MHSDPSFPISFQRGDETSELIVPPLPADMICAWCRGLKRTAAEMCVNCRDNLDALGRIVEIDPITLYYKPTKLRDWLTFYKSGDEALADSAAGEAVAHILANFFAANADRLSHLDIEGVVVVPSTHRAPPHPLAVLLQATGASPYPVLTGLRRTAQPLGHNQPNVGAFVVVESLALKRVLLVDDVYTSGARAQSAAEALTRAGVTVAAIWVVGRRYNREWSAESLEVVTEQASLPFEWNLDTRALRQTSRA